MSKKDIQEAFQNIGNGDYSWTLYFLKIDRRKKDNPYFVYKHTFKNTTYLPEYIKSLCESVIEHQIVPLENVQNYNGSNSKTSCDKIALDNELIAEQWGQFAGAVAGAPREQIDGKYQGYVLDGHSSKDGFPSITIIKAGNPVITLDRKNSKVFKYSADRELAQLTDDLCRLYLSADCFVIGTTLYTFNLNFEGIFNLEKTLHKLKNQAVETILATNSFEDNDQTKKYLAAYTSPKTFLTIKSQRVDKLKNESGRKEVAERLKIETSDNGMIKLKSQDEANRLIKYLCNKIFQDKETDNLIEVNSVVNENVLSK